MIAAQMCGAIPVPLYQDAVAEEMAYVLDHCGARFVLCGDQEQVDKVLEVEQTTGARARIIYLDGRGLRKYDHANMASLADVQAQGRAGAATLGPRAGRDHRRAGLRQHLRDALHQRHDGQAQGRGPVEPQHHRDRRKHPPISTI